MALVGKTALRRRFGGTHPDRKKVACTQQADLNEIGMRRRAVGRAERPGELKAIRRAGNLRQAIGSDIRRHVVVQPLPRQTRHALRTAAGRAAAWTAELRTQAVQDSVKCGVPSQALARTEKRTAGCADAMGEQRVVIERGGETRITAACVGQTGPQPWLWQIEHAIGKAPGRPRLPVMLFLWLNQDDTAWRAAPTGATAHEILHTTIGNADEPVIVAVKIIGMRGEAGPDGFDASGGIMHQTDTVGRRCHCAGRRSGRARAAGTMALRPRPDRSCRCWELPVRCSPRAAGVTHSSNSPCNAAAIQQHICIDPDLVSL